MPAPKAELAIAVPQAFQIATSHHCYLMHLCLNLLSPLMGTSRAVSQGPIYHTAGMPKALFTPKQHRKVATVSRQQLQIPAHPTLFDLETVAR